VDGNNRVLFMFEATTGFACFFLDREQTADAVVRALEAHELRMRVLTPGVTIRRYSADFGAPWSRQGNASVVLTAAVRAFVLTRPGLTFVPHAPHSPSASGAENHMARVNATAFGCAFLGCLNMDTAGLDMIIGAEWLYNMALCPGTRITRFTALTGNKFDVTVMPARPGQLGWIYDENSGGKTLTGQPRVLSAYAVAPDWATTGIWVRVLSTLRLRLVRSMHVLDDMSARSALLDGSALATFRGTLTDPGATSQHDRLATLLADCRDVPPEELA